MLVKIYIIGILIIFLWFLLSNNMLCNVHILIMQKILLDASLILDKSFVHIYLNPSFQFVVQFVDQICKVFYCNMMNGFHWFWINIAGNVKNFRQYDVFCMYGSTNSNGDVNKWVVLISFIGMAWYVYLSCVNVNSIIWMIIFWGRYD